MLPAVFAPEASAVARLLDRRVGERPLWLLLLAALGGALLLIVAVTRWSVPSDEHAYWLAARRLIEGQPLYDPAATIITPYAYLYPPPLAQVLVPVALILPAWWFSALWTVGMGAAMWWLAGRDVLRALACVAFLPVAVEFWFRNVHLFLAVLIVLGLRQASGWLAVGAAIKVSPGLGLAWLAARGRWSAAAQMALIGLGLLAASVALGPDQWLAWLEYLGGQDPFAQSAFFGTPFPVRAVVALGIAVVAGRLPGWRGEVGFVIAATLALPSLWFTGMSLLIAAVPLYRTRARALSLGGPSAPPGEQGEDRAGEREGGVQQPAR
jgi:hypothetical protein